MEPHDIHVSVPPTPPYRANYDAGDTPNPWGADVPPAPSTAPASSSYAANTSYASSARALEATRKQPAAYRSSPALAGTHRAAPPPVMRGWSAGPSVNGPLRGTRMSVEKRSAAAARPPPAAVEPVQSEAERLQDLRKHRLRALPLLGRNVVLLSACMLWLVALIIFFTDVYWRGLDGGTIVVSGRGQLSLPAWPSPHGQWVTLFCLSAGFVTFSFELLTCARPTVRTDRLLWVVRVPLYFGMSLPGLVVMESLMPPLLPSVLLLLGSLLFAPAALGLGAAPTKKEWSWPLLGACGVNPATTNPKKNEEAGGRPRAESGYADFGDFLRKAPREAYVHLWTGSKLPKYRFLLGYSVLNLALWVAAYVHHEASPKGRALRGESFLACRSGGDGSGALLPCARADDPEGVTVDSSPLLLLRGTGHWFPVAKGFGQLLNLNCALLLLPVVRSLVKAPQPEP